MTDFSKQMWDAYAEQAGGKTFDGKPLPTWEELGEERQGCWAAASKAAANQIEALKDDIHWMADKYQSVTRRAHAHADEAAKRIEELKQALNEIHKCKTLYGAQSIAIRALEKAND